MVPTRIRFVVTPLLSAWHCGPKIGFGSWGWGVGWVGWGTDAPNRLFMKGVALSNFLLLLPSDLLCLTLSSSRFKYNAWTINYFLVYFLLCFDLKLPFSENINSDTQSTSRQINTTQNGYRFECNGTMRLGYHKTKGEMFGSEWEAAVWVWIVIWKSETMCCWCNVLLYVCFMADHVIFAWIYEIVLYFVSLCLPYSSSPFA